MNEFFLDVIVVLWFDSIGKYFLVVVFEKGDQLVNGVFLNIVLQFQIYILEVYVYKWIVKVFFKDDCVLIFEKVVDEKNINVIIFMVVVCLSEVVEFFKSDVV